MTDLERIRADLRDEPAEDVQVADDPAFDAELAAALSDEDWSPAMLEAISELVEPVPLSHTAANAAVQRVMGELGGEAAQLDLSARRHEAGMSEDEAAAMLGVNTARLQRLEGQAWRAWLNLQPATVSLYLARVGLSADLFARWLAGRFGGPEQAFGYRPGMVADDPVTVADQAAADERRDWFEAILTAPNPDRYPADQVVEVFGVRWSPADVERRRGRTTRHVQATILRELPTISSERVVELMETRIDHWVEQGLLIALPSHGGPRYPAFQFDRTQHRIWPAVAYCNQRLQANRDPWGAASWWITHHEWLRRRPLELVEPAGDQEQLRQAADMIGDYQG